MPTKAKAPAVLLIAILSVALSVLPATASEPDPGQNPPAGVPEDWWREVQRSIRLEEYAVLDDDAMQAGFYRAVNPAHRFEGRFDADGVRVKPVGNRLWTWGLSLRAWGRPDAPEATLAARLSPDGSRIELDRGSLTEWFVNGPEGLEHGFTVPVPPRAAGDVLAFDLALAGGLRPVFAEDGQAIDFYADGAVGVLSYSKLVVTDAVGEVLPARMEPIAGGVRIVVEDGGAIYPITVDPIATSPSWTAQGEAGDDRFGYSVATAGDVNGDGYSDVIVGAWASTSTTGRAYLFLGGASGLQATPARTLFGAEDDSRFGLSVATAGDVNGDGYSDVIVGAPGLWEKDFLGRINHVPGAAYLYLGSASGLAPTPSRKFAVKNPNSSGDDSSFGHSVSTAGDVNGDGYSDIIVGAWKFFSDTGRAYLFLGGPNGPAAQPWWVGVGEADDDQFGNAVATAGDVNGDGFSDVIVGAYLNNQGGTDAGKAYLYLGGVDGLASSPSWSRAGEAAGDRFGVSVSTAGDVNGDGYSDVIVGAFGNDQGGADAGKAYLYLGGAGGLATGPSWSRAGEAAGDRYGNSVATAGDANGDGYSDVIVGAPGNASNRGKAYLYPGSASGLATSPSWTAVGEPAGGGFGLSVAVAGDVNGDAHSDLVVGAHVHSGGRGKAYLYPGGASGPEPTSSWNPVGEAFNSGFGRPVATAGDVDGDGYADVIVAAPTQFNSFGRAYLFRGGANGLSTIVSWTAAGTAANERFGWSVASAGDVNGDGYADVIVGADGHNSGRGKVSVYLGGPGGLAASPSWTVVGAAPGEHLGVSVSTAGDVNGDGYADVIVGAVSDSLTGMAQVYLGGASGLARSPSWTVPSNTFGGSVSTAGDVNGDGFSDVVVGAYGHGNFAGAAYLYLGSASGLPALHSWVGSGEAAGDRYGASVATAGDVNGDGYSDVIVGAAVNAGQRGKAYLYLGGPGGLATTASWTAAGEAAGDQFAASVATAGDVNRDGYSDVIVGAPWGNGGTGRAYVYAGSAIGLGTSATWTATGQSFLDQFGGSVSTAGDVSGDGFSDVIVGAFFGNGGTGTAHLYHGGGRVGVSLRPRQMRSDLSAPIGPGGRAFDQRFALGLTLRGPAGRVWRTLQWQVAPWGVVFDPAIHPIQTDAAWYGVAGALTEPIVLPQDQQRYVWRARVRFHPAQSPFVPRGPWVAMSGNGLYEADVLSTSQPFCVTPDEELYITMVTLDGGGLVIHFQDSNQPAHVTGYNVYRAPAPQGPWTLLGSNVADMDPGLPDIQYVDPTGGAGGPWYYEVAPWNAVCGAEGPW